MPCGHVILALCLYVSVVESANFTWLRRPGDVHACLHGEAAFPWHYNSSLYKKVSAVYWRGSNKVTMYALHREGDQLVPQEYPSDIYSGRVFRMTPEEANLGLILKDVTKEDEGEYRIEVGGYDRAIYRAYLYVHSMSDLRPSLVVDNQEESFGQTLNKSDQVGSTVTIRTSESNLPADINITITGRPDSIVCDDSSVCTATLQFDQINAPTVQLQFYMRYNVCEPHNLSLDILTGRQYLPPDTTAQLTETSSIDDLVPVQSKFPIWIIAVIAGIIIAALFVYLLLAFLWFQYKDRQRKGKSLKNRQQNFLDNPCMGIPMTALYNRKHGDKVAEDSKKNGSKSSAKESTPLVERKNPSPPISEPESGNVIFISIAKAKNLNQATIDILVQNDYDTEEALACMEERDINEMGIVDTQKDFVKLWIDELRSRTTRSGDSHTLSNTNDSSTMHSVSSNGEFSIEDCLRNLQMSEKNKREVSDYVLKHGVLGLESLLRDKLKAYMGSPVNIAVTGRSGTGKSSLINTLRGLRALDKDAAKVGVTETTFEMKPYHHPDIKNVVFWDLPGVGTPNFPKPSYLKDVEFKRYDAFIITATERLTQDDIWLAKEATSLNTPFYFLRTKIDTDVANNKRDGDGNEKKLLAHIRSDIHNHLTQEDLPGDRVFLISNILKNKRKWDFPKLVKDLVSRTPERNKFAMIMAMVTCSKEIILLKKEDLQSRITTVALTAALSDGDHEDILKQEIGLYMECFGVRSEDMADVDMTKLDTRLNDIKHMLDAIVSQPVEESVKGRQVGRWILGIGYFVGMIIDASINKVRQAEYERHVEESTQLSRQFAKDAIVEEAIYLLKIVLDRCEELALAVLEQKQYL